MIEVPFDHIFGSHVTIHGSELASWERLCMSLRIDDVWHHEVFGREQGSLLFSNSDRQIGGSNLSWIDQFYVNDWLGACGGSIGILADTSMSDHAPIILVISDAR